MKGYVYLGSQLLAVQASSSVTWVHQDPATKSQRLTDAAGTVTTSIDLDPWGTETARSVNSTQQPRKYTTYELDGDASDEAMMRRYRARHQRFDQPDPSDGSYDLTDPQSFNRYAYVNNDPVNFVDPSGLERCNPLDSRTDCGSGDYMTWGQVMRDLAREEYWGGYSASGRGVEPIPPNPDRLDTGTDCTRFAAEVDAIASKHSNYISSVRALKERFATGRYDDANRDFASTGFKERFRDDTPAQPGGSDNSPNQVRHYAGNFYAVALTEAVGREIMRRREGSGTTPSQRADLVSCFHTD